MNDLGLQERVARLEGRVGDFGRRFDEHRSQADRHFRRVTGVQVTVLVSVIGTLFLR